MQVAHLAQDGEISVVGDDRLASVGNLSFAPRLAPRIAPLALELLAGRELVRRSGTVATPDA